MQATGFKRVSLLCAAVSEHSPIGQFLLRVFRWDADFPAAFHVLSFSLSTQIAADAYTVVQPGCMSPVVVSQLCTCPGPLVSIST